MFDMHLNPHLLMCWLLFSIAFWAITLITIVRYILIVMNLNDDGEGVLLLLYMTLITCQAWSTS